VRNGGYLLTVTLRGSLMHLSSAVRNRSRHSVERDDCLDRYRSTLLFVRIRQQSQYAPLPGQVAALVTLLERASPAEQQLILHRRYLQALTARLETGIHLGDAETAARPEIDGTSGRPIPRCCRRSAKQCDDLTRARRQGWLGFTFVTPVDLELRVGLATGDTLVVDALSYPVANILGVPVDSWRV